MSTAFAQIVTAIIGALSASPAVCATIYRARPIDVPQQVEQAINVQWDAATADDGVIAGAPIDWASRVSVECFARSVSESGDLAVDPLLAATFERLAQDSTLSGLVGNLRVVGMEAENAAEARKTGWVRITYLADHRTSNATLN